MKNRYIKHTHILKQKESKYTNRISNQKEYEGRVESKLEKNQPIPEISGERF